MGNAPQELTGDTKRLLEIIKVMSRYKLMQGMTPEKLCAIFNELGPTFVKLGQLLSMHPEVIPMEYCEELKSLRTNATPLITAQMREVISEEYGKPWNSVFERILPLPLGAASIAQVHEAYLLDGSHVAVKIQRPGIYETMERDCRLLKKALGIVKIKDFANVMDLCDCIDQMWNVAKEEMDFLREAENIRTVRKNIEGIQYVYCPKVYDELTTRNVLVMEYIGGFELNDKKAMEEQGYDVKEVCTKFINNYIKQFAEDRFFHADPHPGNIHVQDGRIVWLDLGMMGRLTEKDANLVTGCMRAIFTNDHIEFADNVLEICDHAPIADMNAYYARMKAYLEKYRVISMADMSSTVDILADLYHIAKDFGIIVPSSMTMYWRSLGIMEGTVSDLDPETDLAAIIGKHMAAQALVKGVVGSITKSISHKKLISGKPLSYNGHIQEPDEEIDETEE